MSHPCCGCAAEVSTISWLSLVDVGQADFTRHVFCGWDCLTPFLEAGKPEHTHPWDTKE